MPRKKETKPNQGIQKKNRPALIEEEIQIAKDTEQKETVTLSEQSSKAVKPTTNHGKQTQKTAPSARQNISLTSKEIAKDIFDLYIKYSTLTMGVFALFQYGIPGIIKPLNGTPIIPPLNVTADFTATGKLNVDSVLDQKINTSISHTERFGEDFYVPGISLPQQTTNDALKNSAILGGVALLAQLFSYKLGKNIKEQKEAIDNFLKDEAKVDAIHNFLKAHYSDTIPDYGVRNKKAAVQAALQSLMQDPSIDKTLKEEIEKSQAKFQQELEARIKADKVNKKSPSAPYSPVTVATAHLGKYVAEFFASCAPTVASLGTFMVQFYQGTPISDKLEGRALYGPETIPVQYGDSYNLTNPVATADTEWKILGNIRIPEITFPDVFSSSTVGYYLMGSSMVALMLGHSLKQKCQQVITSDKKYQETKEQLGLPKDPSLTERLWNGATTCLSGCGYYASRVGSVGSYLNPFNYRLFGGGTPINTPVELKEIISVTDNPFYKPSTKENPLYESPNTSGDEKDFHGKQEISDSSGSERKARRDSFSSSEGGQEKKSFPIKSSKKEIGTGNKSESEEELMPPKKYNKEGHKSIASTSTSVDAKSITTSQNGKNGSFRDKHPKQEKKDLFLSQPAQRKSHVRRHSTGSSEQFRTT